MSISIHEQLKQYRLAAKLTLEEVYDLTFISTSVLSNIENGKRGLSYEEVQNLAEIYGHQIQLVPIDATANITRLDFTIKKDRHSVGANFFNYWWQNQSHTALPKNFLDEFCSTSLKNKYSFLNGIVREMNQIEDPYDPTEPSSEMYYKDWSKQTLGQYGVTAFIIDTFMLSEKLPYICDNYTDLKNEFKDGELQLTTKAFDMLRGDLIEYPLYKMFKDAHVIKKSFIFNFPTDGVTSNTFRNPQ